MATYTELRSLFSDSELLNKVTIATVVYAHNAIGTATVKEKAWIAQTLQSPTAEAKKILMGVLAANKGATVDQIKGASDASIQAQVDLIVPILIDALAGV